MRTSEVDHQKPRQRALRGNFVYARKQRAVFLSDKLTFVRQKCSLCEAAVSSRVGHPKTRDMETLKKKIGRPTVSDPKVHRYNFKLNEEQNLRFEKMLCEAELEHNRSRFIVKRIFAEEFIIIKRDPSKIQFIARLNDFYYQFQRIGNNYNQIVKAINAHFSSTLIPKQIVALEHKTQELKALSIEILNLAKHAAELLKR